MWGSDVPDSRSAASDDHSPERAVRYRIALCSPSRHTTVGVNRGVIGNASIRSIHGLNCAFALVCALRPPRSPAEHHGRPGQRRRRGEKKFVALAKAIPAEKYDWRPGAGVRSVGEVIRHVASDNYLIPAALGFAADPSTGIKGDDYKTAQAFESEEVDEGADGRRPREVVRAPEAEHAGDAGRRSSAIR